MGDFTGFSFGNWHSTDPTTGVVNVIRVSGGDRYDEQLHPEILLWVRFWHKVF